MQGASHFVFDGISSQDYALQLVAIDENAVKEVTAFSATLRTRKPSRIDRYFHGGVTYDRPPEHQLTVMCNTPGGLTDNNRRAILKWLVGRNSFRTLVLIGEANKYTYRGLNCYPAYRAVFTQAEAIYIQNRCYGFRLNVTLDSPYAMLYKETTNVGNGAVEYVMVDMWADGKHAISADGDTGCRHNITWTNDSDIKFGYVYPKIYIKGGSTQDVSLEIVNTSDNNRKFKIENCSHNVEATIDCELKTIKAITGSASVSNLAEDGRYWLRLKPGLNTLVTVKSDASLSFDFQAPVYIAHGF